MKELVINNGGRRLFNEDLNSIQDHLIAIQNIFASESPFVLSGIQYSLVSGTTYNISDGYVWLGGKLRYFAGATSIDLSTPQYINVSDSTSSRLYEDSVTRIAVQDFNTTTSTTFVNSNDSLRIDQPSDTRRYFQNVLGDKYLQLNSSDTEYILGDIVFNGTVNSTSSISTTGLLTAGSGQINGNLNVTGTLDVTGLATLGTLDVNQVNVNNMDVDFQLKAGTYVAGNGSGAVINNDGSISTNRVTSDSILAGAVDTAELADLAVETAKIDNLAVTTGKIADDAVTGDKIDDLSIEDRHIKDLSLNGGRVFQDYTITRNAMADNAVSGDVIEGRGVELGKIAQDAVTDYEIAENSVGTSELKVDAVYNENIKSGAVNADKISNGSVTKDKLGSGTMKVHANGSHNFSSVPIGGEANTSILVSTGLGTNYSVLLTCVANNSGAVATISEKTTGSFKIRVTNTKASQVVLVEYAIVQYV